MAKTIHERKPRYEAGDWVEIEQEHAGNIERYHRKVELYSETSDAYSMKTIVCGEFEFTVDGEPYDCPYHDNWHPDHRIVRKLDPFEVRVKITLEGQVTKPIDNAGGRFWLYYSTDEYVSIELDALSHKDRELVERLLKAQEEK